MFLAAEESAIHSAAVIESLTYALSRYSRETIIPKSVARRLYFSLSVLLVYRRTSSSRLIPVMADVEFKVRNAGEPRIFGTFRAGDLSKAQRRNLKGRFDPLHKESQPGYRVIDDFADQISFYPCKNDLNKDRELDHLCLSALEQPNSTGHYRLYQLLMVGIQVISSKAASGDIQMQN